MNPKRRAEAARRFPNVALFQDGESLLASRDIAAVLIATPPESHYDLALAALRAGKHVLVEKPLALRYEQAQELVDTAERQRLTLMVDHTYVYSGAIRKIRTLLEQQELGDLYYLDSVRVNLGQLRPTVSVVWDLACHDLSILDYLLDQRPTAVSATGARHILDPADEHAHLTLFYPAGMTANVHVSWLAPVKLRRITIGGSQKMLLFDDVEPDEKLRIYDRGVCALSGTDAEETVGVRYRSGDTWIPCIAPTEALQQVIKEFVKEVRSQRSASGNGRAAMRIIRVLEAADRSITKRGATPRRRQRMICQSKDVVFPRRRSIVRSRYGVACR